MKSVIFLMSIILVTTPTVFAYEQSQTDYGGHVGYRIANFKGVQSTYPIWYKITNATVSSTPLDLSTKSLLFFINATNNGRLIVELPRSIIDSKNYNDDKPFFVMAHDANNEFSQIPATEINDTYVRTLEINFTKNINEIQITGNLFVEKYLSNPIAKPSPLSQFKSGTKPENIMCNVSFQLVLKRSDGSPACVRPASAQYLIDIGWARPASYYHDLHVWPKITLDDYPYDGITTDTNTTVSISNYTYYQTTIGYSAYNLPKELDINFHNVTFTFPAGTIVTPGGAMIMLDLKFPDGFEETYGYSTENEFSGLSVPTQYGPHHAVNSTTILSNHALPQAGITMYHDKIRLLVSAR